MMDLPLTDVSVSEISLTDVSVFEIALTDVSVSEMALTDVPFTDVPLTDRSVLDASMSDGISRDLVSSDAGATELGRDSGAFAERADATPAAPSGCACGLRAAAPRTHTALWALALLGLVRRRPFEV